MKLLIFVSSLLLSAVVNADLNLELPDSAVPVIEGQAGQIGITSNAFPERTHGLAILRKLRGSGRLIDDPQINTWIRSIGNRLVSNASHSSMPFYFVVSRDLSVNAFATIGGVIVINAGLILETESEDELAAVMAHEVAHITQRHIYRMIEKSKNNNLARNVTLLAGIIASSKNSQAGQAIITAASATMAHKQLAFSRAAESEADRVGLRLLARSGFNPKAMPSFLKKLERFGHDKNAAITEFLQNHPLTLKRVSDTQERAARITYNKRKVSSDNYYYVKEKIRRLTNAPNGIAAGSSAKIKKYAQALGFLKSGNSSQALQIMNGKSNIIPEVLLISQLLNKHRRYKQSILLLEPLLDLYVDNEALSISLAKTYISIGEKSHAWIVLNEVNETELTSLEFFEMKQQVARMLGKNAEAYRSAAERNVRMGNYKSAGSLLRQAIKSRGANTNQLSKIQARLVEITKK